MVLVLRLVAGAFALLFLFMGVGFLLDPAGSAVGMAVTPEGVHGLNTLRSDVAGMFIGSGLMIGLGLFRREAIWLLAVALLMVAIAIGRLLSFALDGTEQATLIAFVFEVVIAAVMLLAARMLPARS